MKAQDVVKILQGKVKKLGTQQALADEIGVSLPYLNEVLNGRRDPGPTVAEYLGLKKTSSHATKMTPGIVSPPASANRTLTTKP